MAKFFLKEVKCTLIHMEEVMLQAQQWTLQGSCRNDIIIEKWWLFSFQLMFLKLIFCISKCQYCVNRNVSKHVCANASLPQLSVTPVTHQVFTKYCATKLVKGIFVKVIVQHVLTLIADWQTIIILHVCMESVAMQKNDYCNEFI